MKKKDILYLAAVLVVLGCILGLYKINSLIPDGILVSGAAEENIEKMYRELYETMAAYDMGTVRDGSGQKEADTPHAPGQIPDGQQSAVLITPKEGAGQILAFTLGKKFPDAYVRDLATERGMRLGALMILSCVVLFAVFNHVLFGFLGARGKEYRYLLRLGEFFALCFLVRGRGVLPAAALPQKFIFFGEWWAKCRGYFGSLRGAGQIPCGRYQAFAGLQGGLAVLLFVGLVGILAAGRTGRKKG